nr:hypothetical protein HK105_003042 [Polyrhizophydium stewartii]
MVLEVLAAHHESCPLRTVACDLARFGCTWTGPRASLHRYHTESCAYVAIQGFFVIHERQMAQMALENAELRQTMSMFDAKLDMLAKQFDDLQVSLRDVGPPPMLIDQMSREMQMMKADLANINTLAIQQDVSLMSENTRLREEMQSIRTICQSIQSQLIGLAIEHRKAAASKFSNGVSAAAASAAAAAAAAITGGVASSGSSAASSSQSAPSAAATAAASASAAGAGPGPQRPAPPQGDYQQQFEQRFPRSRTDTGTKL